MGGILLEGENEKIMRLESRGGEGRGGDEPTSGRGGDNAKGRGNRPKAHYDELLNGDAYDVNGMANPRDEGNASPFTQ